MVAIEEARARKLMDGAVREGMPPWGEAESHEYRAVGDRAQREYRPGLRSGDLRRKVAVAAAHFFRQGLVLRWQAFHRVGDAAAEELEAVLRIGRALVAGEAEAVQRPVEEDAGLVPGEGTAGAVRPVQAGSEADHEQRSFLGTERRDRPRVVVRVLAPDLGEMPGEPRAVAAVGIERQ